MSWVYDATDFHTLPTLGNFIGFSVIAVYKQDGTSFSGIDYHLWGVDASDGSHAGNQYYALATGHSIPPAAAKDHFIRCIGSHDSEKFGMHSQTKRTAGTTILTGANGAWCVAAGVWSTSSLRRVYGMEAGDLSTYSTSTSSGTTNTTPARTVTHYVQTDNGNTGGGRLARTVRMLLLINRVISEHEFKMVGMGGDPIHIFGKDSIALTFQQTQWRMESENAAVGLRGNSPVFTRNLINPGGSNNPTAIGGGVGGW